MTVLDLLDRVIAHINTLLPYGNSVTARYTDFEQGQRDICFNLIDYLEDLEDAIHRDWK
jgi:hypothetical protein